jgi:glutaredoxin
MWLWREFSHGIKMIKIYGKENCLFCDKAKQLCSSKEINFRYYQLGQDYEIKELMELVPTARTMPQIFKEYNEEDTMESTPLYHIGGFTELQEWLK